MGPSRWQKHPTPYLQVTMLGAALICCLLLSSSPLVAQGANPISTLPPASAEAQDPLAIGSVSGTVMDVTGAPVSGAQVSLTPEASTQSVETLTQPDGHFFFANVAPGPFELKVALAGFKPKTASGTLSSTQGCLVSAITLEVAPVVTDVNVRLTTEEVAAEQIKVQEQQRLIGVIPNFYASYIPDAAPMNTKQKFGLAWKAAIDPTSFVIAAIIAGGEQADNSFPGYGQGAAGYARRFGAAYGDFFIGNYISNAILPSILKQDPRYFYKGTGTVKSRIRYALEMAVITKGDNGRWQPNYSGILGSLASGAISNLYYPEGSQHGFETTLNNTLIGIGTSAGVNILQEFVFPKFTPKKPLKSDHPTS